MRAGNSPVSGSPPTAERDPRVRVEVRLDDKTRRAALEEDVKRGLLARPRQLPPKDFYDGAGCAAFPALPPRAGVIPDARQARDPLRGGRIPDARAASEGDR